jgi:Flp pilus assembly protein TadG
MVVLFLGLFLAVGLVFDGGQVLATRRAVISAAESSARLAANRSDPFGGLVDAAEARSVVESYVASLDGISVVDVRVDAAAGRVVVTLRATAREAFFPLAGLAPAVVTETGSAEVRR